MTQVATWQRWWVQALAAGGVAVLVPVGTDWLEWTRTLPEDITVGVGVWICGMIVQIAHSLHSFHVERLEVKHILEVISESDQLLLELQTKFREIASRKLNDRPNYVFLDYCRRSLEESLKTARRAAQRGELEVHDHHFDTVDTVLAAFQGCRDRTYRCVWLIEDGEELFDKFWRQYMTSLVSLSREKCVNRRVRVRVLFVAENQAQLERSTVRTILSFVSTEPGFDYCVISHDDYRTRLRDSRLDVDCIDFGVYGDHLLFRTISYEPHVGVFSDQQIAIQAYRTMHDAAMNAVGTLNVGTELPVGVTLESFLNSDAMDGGDGRKRGRR